MKKCKLCGEFKHLDDFFNHRKSKDGKTYTCKQCSSKNTISWQRRNKEAACKKAARWRLKSKYNSSEEEILLLVKNQSNKCAICGLDGDTLVNGLQKGLHIDHCHVKGKVRGMLCAQCNQAIGKLRDSPQNAYNAYLYLKNFYEDS